ncbi:MAG: mannose-6-phosphate isomerase, class I [Micrococcales bacterium]
MLRKITNQALPYGWGSPSLIADYFGIAATGQPMAEIWFGTHEGSLTRDLEQAERSLLELRDGKPLSFLLKILAAGTPLSIQVHPSKQQAELGFARENASGIALSAAHRNYKDANHKPELIVALSEFEALAGFKTEQQIRELLEDIASYPTDAELHESAITWMHLLDDSLQALIAQLLSNRSDFAGRSIALAALAEFDGRFELAARLHALYPDDPGILVALLMNHIHLEAGEALYLDAGKVHAYLSGLGIEIMAASDNVLRGGLTPKHIDVAELLEVANFVGGPETLAKQIKVAQGLYEFASPVDDFVLYRVEPSAGHLLADLNLGGDAIAICTGGEVAISNSLDERLVLKRGEAAYISADARFTSFTGAGTLFVGVGR